MIHKKIIRPRIGLYSMGLKHYWSQFEGLKERLLEYGKFIGEKVKKLGADVYYYGMIDCDAEGKLENILTVIT